MTRFEIYAQTFKLLLENAKKSPFKKAWRELNYLRQGVYGWYLEDQISIRQYLYFSRQVDNAMTTIYRNEV